MKKIVSIFAVSVCILLSSNTFAQKKGKSFAGTIKFSLEYQGEIDPQQSSQLPKEASAEVFENYQKVAINAGGFYIYQIYNGEKKDLTMLYDIPGQQMAVTIPAEYLQEQQEGTKYAYEKTGDTKEICGYTCTGWKITVTNEDDETNVQTVYTTTEIGASSAINFASAPGLEGYPLYTETMQGDMKIIQTAKEIKKGKVSLANMLIPTSYKTLTFEEFQELINSSSNESDF